MVSFYNIEATEADGVEEPITLAEAKAHLQVDFDDDDDYIQRLITAARQTLEDFTNLALVEKTMTADAANVCTGDLMRLPYAAKVSDVVVTDSDTEELLAVDEYKVGRNSVKVNYKGNYSLSYTVVPSVSKALKEAILLEVAQRYKHRGDNSEGISTAAKEKAQPYRVIWL
jgi:hypothetical protein